MSASSTPPTRSTAEPAAAGQAASGSPAAPDGTKTRLAAVRDTAGAVLGAVLGLVPHLLHHVTLIAGTALVTGAGGNALFFAVGLLLSVPMLRRLHRRFGSWVAPAIAVAVFVAMFSLSAFVVGPAISGQSATPSAPAIPSPGHTGDGTQHHTP